MTVVGYRKLEWLWWDVENSKNSYNIQWQWIWHKNREITKIFGFCCCIYLAEIKVGNRCHLQFEKFVRKCFSDVMLRVTRHIRTHMNENLIKFDIINLTNVYRLLSIHDSRLHMGTYAYPNINFMSLVYVLL